MTNQRLARLALGLAACLGATGGAAAHDMFLKLDSFFVPSGAQVELALLNGSFAESENAVSRDRMADVRVVGPEDAVERPAAAAWRDLDATALLQLRTGEPGTYVAGVSTEPSVIELSADDFNRYLEHDGVLDVLQARREDGSLGRAARERYSKHVKAVFQVGETRSGAWSRRFGYPAEIVPLDNPYALEPGAALRVLFLVDGRPVAGQRLYASHEAFAAADGGGHREALALRTDEAGVAAVELRETGRWYVRTIHMTASDDADLDYVSNWATLTFEVR